ncbi:MAG: F0F1 ATP synthase subunit A [Bacteroidota bacterium]
MLAKKILTITLLSLFTLWGFAQDEHPTKDHDDHATHETQHEEGDHPTDEAKHEGGTHADTHHSGDGHHTKKYVASEAILHHILDTHDWEIVEFGDTHVKLTLPYFFYSSQDGFVFAANKEALKEKGYSVSHEKIVYGDAHHGDSHGHEGDHEKGPMIIDLSITKTSLQMIMIGLLLTIVFVAVAGAYSRREGEAPSGMQSFMEPIIVFIRDEVAKPYLGDKTMAFLPYLLTLFFFIWFANLFGLMPFNSNIAGNISVTAALAVMTFILTQVNGSKDHWKHVFNTPGVPWWLKFGIPLMPIVEFIGLFTKPFALAVRLFANITAGHFMVLGLISLIFIMGSVDQVPGVNTTGAFGIMPISVLFTIVIFMLEMIVAIIQPYIFTLLTAVFIGMAMESHDDHH